MLTDFPSLPFALLSAELQQNKLAAAMTGDTKYTKATAKKVSENNAAKTIAAERAEIALLTAQNAALARNARLQRALKARKQQNPIEVIQHVRTLMLLSRNKQVIRVCFLLTLAASCALPSSVSFSASS